VQPPSQTPHIPENHRRHRRPRRPSHPVSLLASAPLAVPYARPRILPIGSQQHHRHHEALLRRRTSHVSPALKGCGLTTWQVLDNTKKPALQLCGAHELSDFSRFTRNEYGNFMTMISKTVAERTGAGQRQSVEEGGAFSLNRTPTNYVGPGSHVDGIQTTSSTAMPGPKASPASSSPRTTPPSRRTACSPS
jgi:hypothetical protein